MKDKEKINWGKSNGLIPAIIQDDVSGVILMLGFMSKEALEKTLETGEVWFYSRTKKRLWKKGETSGNTLKVVDARIDCDFDSVLIRALPNGPTCHTGKVSCFDYEIRGLPAQAGGALSELFAVVEGRKKEMPKGSYTAELFNAGADKISLKVSEEAMEVIQAAQKETEKRLTEESVDLLYHLFVLLAAKRVSLKDLETEIQARMAKHRNV